MRIFLLSLALLTFAVRAGAEMNWEDSRFLDANYSKRISMDLKDASLVDVLKIFSRQSGMNFIASQEVSGKKITLFLENIPVEEALQKILKANDLTYEMQEGSDIFIVKPSLAGQKKFITRVYLLKNATVPSSKLNKTISISSSDSSAASSTAASGPSLGGASGESSNGILAAIKAVLSKDGSLVEDPRTNSLIITDDETRFPLIESTIVQLDVPVAEILIEVEMLDVSKNTADKLGIKYGDTPLSISGSKRGTLFPLARDINAQNLVDKAYLEALPQYTLGTIDASKFSATMQFLRTRTDTKNLARPRLLTLNNQTAQIKISTNEAIGVANVTNSSQSSSTQSVEAERVATGVFLTVTPQANVATGEIIMALYPKVIQARAGNILDSLGRPFKDPEERGSQSMLKVTDGQTIVIGGLLRTDTTNTITKVPILGDIPLIGGAFRHKDKEDTERELIIFLTPHILDRNKRTISAEDPIRSHEVSKALATIEQQRF